MEFQPPDVSLLAILPTTIVAVTALFVLLQGVLGSPNVLRAVRNAHLGLAAAAVATLLVGLAGGRTCFGGMLVADRAAVVFYTVFLATTAFGVSLLVEHVQREDTELIECVTLLLLSCTGMMFMAGTGSLVMIFVGLETMSIALYILSGVAGLRDERSNEAALKYLLLGSFATGFLLYGMAFVYGATGSIDLGQIAYRVSRGEAIGGFLNVGLALLLIGLGFKVALVPFHMWAPDVYEGAPTPVTAFMSVGVKVAAFAALMRVFDQSLLPVRAVWGDALWWLALATMLVGNVSALAQTSLKRLLAYSSIAHAGYLAIGILAANRQGMQGVLFYSLAYTFMNLGAFVVLLSVGNEELTTLDDLRGLARRAPCVAGCMALFMFSLAGVPPLAGFLGKWLLFSAAVADGNIGLAVLAVLCSAISAYYYLRVVYLMYMCPSADEQPAELPRCHTRLALYVCGVATVVLSFPLGFYFVAWAGWATAMPR